MSGTLPTFIAALMLSCHRGLAEAETLKDDPAWFVPSLREVLPAYEALIGSDGTLAWRGWHYRERENDLLRYWSHEMVTVRPSPTSEALIWVYWKQDILCQAVAEELCHKDGTYHPYWFPCGLSSDISNTSSCFNSSKSSFLPTVTSVTKEDTLPSSVRQFAF